MLVSTLCFGVYEPYSRLVITAVLWLLKRKGGCRGWFPGPLQRGGGVLPSLLKPGVLRCSVESKASRELLYACGYGTRF